MLFLIFDVEAAFLFPWAVVFQKIGAVAFSHPFSNAHCPVFHFTT
ncbi:MAG: NADH-quinone oxidoreductase subunit A [Bacteroidetes bacterium]|nr:MAG: NADH-quinone oxidoreductase subunit A [Bacteroidota bacterium]TDI81295.1 MAG: NADH-quinone oxidoreductase subunit A [Bacteroidota bacterium]